MQEIYCRTPLGSTLREVKRKKAGLGKDNFLSSVKASADPIGTLKLGWAL